jgi:hypothetical protein
MRLSKCCWVTIIVQDTLLMHIMHRSKKMPESQHLLRSAVKGLIYVWLFFMILKLLGKKTHKKILSTESPLEFFYILCRCNSMVPTGKESMRKEGGRTSTVVPVSLPWNRGAWHTHTHLGNVLLHTHHLFSHPFARDYGTTPHWRTFNRCYCEFTFPILLVAGLNLFFPRNCLWFFPIKYWENFRILFSSINSTKFANFYGKFCWIFNITKLKNKTPIWNKSRTILPLPPLRKKGRVFKKWRTLTSKILG